MPICECSCPSTYSCQLLYCRASFSSRIAFSKRGGWACRSLPAVSMEAMTFFIVIRENRTKISAKTIRPTIRDPHQASLRTKISISSTATAAAAEIRMLYIGNSFNTMRNWDKRESASGCGRNHLAVLFGEFCDNNAPARFEGNPDFQIVPGGEQLGRYIETLGQGVDGVAGFNGIIFCVTPFSCGCRAGS